MSSIPIILILLAAAGALLIRKGHKPEWLRGTTRRHIEILDRVALSHQHSIHLISLRGRWMAVAVSPQGCILLDSGSDSEHGIAKGHAV